MTTRRNTLKSVCLIALTLCATAMSSPVKADGFYQDKTLELVVPVGVGGGTDTLARLVGRHIGRHLPGNPTVVVKNRPGAGGLAAANYLYNRAPRDGTSIGLMEQSLYESQLFKVDGLLADVTKFNWLGRLISNNAVLFARQGAAVKTIEDAFHSELTVSASGRSSLMRWTVLKRLTGIKFKLIVGHRGTAEATLAMERGEVDALSQPWPVFRAMHADWLRDKTVNILLQTGLDRAPDLPNVPRVIDLARTNEQRQLLEMFSRSDRVGRSFAAPPDLPKERVAELRAAFMAMLQDPAFQAEIKPLQLTLDPLSGEELQTMILGWFDYPPALVEKAKALAKYE